jgi:hypothetical protein
MVPMTTKVTEEAMLRTFRVYEHRGSYDAHGEGVYKPEVITRLPYPLRGELPQVGDVLLFQPLSDKQRAAPAKRQRYRVKARGLAYDTTDAPAEECVYVELIGDSE